MPLSHSLDTGKTGRLPGNVPRADVSEGNASLILLGSTPLLCEALEVALAFSEHIAFLDSSVLSNDEDLPRVDLLVCEVGAEHVLSKLDLLPPPTQWIAVVTRPSAELIHAAIRRGAAGVITLQSSLQGLLKCIRQVRAGQVYFDDDVQRHLSSSLRDSTAPRLSPRERQVAVLVAKGLTSRAIAARMKLSVKTVSNHRRNIFRKLGVHDAISMTRYVVDAGWLAPSSPGRRSVEPVLGEEAALWPDVQPKHNRRAQD